MDGCRPTRQQPAAVPIASNFSCQPCTVPATILPAIFTGGAAESLNNGYYSVPKRDLVTGLQVLLQRGALQIAAGLKHAAELVEELTEMRVKVGLEGREQYGAWREGTHDDLVFAVALAYWAARKMYPREGTGEEGYWRCPGWRQREREFRKGGGGGGRPRRGGGEGEERARFPEARLWPIIRVLVAA